MKVNGTITKVTMKESGKTQIVLETTLNPKQVESLSSMVGYDALEVDLTDRRIPLKEGK